MSDYAIVNGLDVKDAYADSSVPGEFRRLTDSLGSEQVAVTLIRIPAHSDFEQSTGHYHDEIEEIYLITKGELTMRFNETIVKVPVGSAVRVAPKTVRSHRNEGDEMVEMWAISKKLGHSDGTKVDDFWKASDQAKQTK
jgi:mannose-6-phosphate isomerase-like protein (cupin superfamily)